MDLYFVSMIPMDFFPSLGIAEIAKALDPTIRTHLILIDGNRYISEGFFSRFDTIHRLTYCSYQKNLASGLARARELRKAAAAIDIQPNSLYFFYEASEPLTHLLFKERLDRVPNILYAKVTVATEPFTRRSRTKRLWWRRSLVMLAYSLALRQRLVRTYVSTLCPITYLPLYRPYHDVDIILETARADSVENAQQTFSDMPYPAKYVRPTSGNDTLELVNQAVVYFLAPDYQHGIISVSQYWDITNKLLEGIAGLYSGSPLYLKLHPADNDSGLRHLTARGWRVIDKSLSPEELYIQNRGRIRAVYTSCSTASLTAATFGVPAYLTYPLVLGTGTLSEFLARYFSPGVGKVVTLHQWEDLTRIGDPQALVAEHEVAGRTRWEECVRLLFETVQGRIDR